MGLRERNYWIETAKERVMGNAETADTYVEELMYLYDEQANQIENEINAMFAKYAKDNELTEAEASRLLSGEEYSKWNKSIRKYIEEAEEKNINSKALLELNTLSVKSRISRKEQLLSNVYKNMITLAGESESKLTELLSDILKVNYEQGCFDIQKGTGFGFNVAKINDSMLKQILEYPWSGENYSKNLWENTDKLAALARREITLGFISGSSVQKMAKEINDIMGKGRYAAERLVRTETSYFSNQAELMAYQENGIEYYEFLGGGCEDCQVLNNSPPIAVGEAEVGVNYPPIHPNCKCTTKASFKIKMFKKRDGANPLDDNIKFQEWKKKYVKDEGLSAKVGGSDGVAEHEEKKYLERIDFGSKDLVKSKINMYTEQIAQDNRIENAVVISPKGNIYQCFGTSSAVYPDFDLKEELVGAYVTHNHPPLETHYSFSDADISLFMEQKLSELVGTDDKYIYSVRKNVDTISATREEIQHLFKTDYYYETVKKSMSGEIDIDTDEYHEIIKLMAEKYHFAYERRSRK